MAVPTIQHDVSLRPFNTFGIDVRARTFVRVRTVAQLRAVVRDPERSQSIFPLGGGSNMLLTQDLNEVLVLKNDIIGIDIVETDNHHAIVGIGGGHSWHEAVLWTLDQRLGGLENLSLIPGTVGAAPIQNIGAYGVELKDVFERLEAVDLRTGTLRTFWPSDCQFGYRSSVFKNELRGAYCIVRVYLRLTQWHHQLHTAYGAISDELERQSIEQPTPRDLSNVVIHIRRSKLPDPKVLGNSGSFFKNPELERNTFERLKVRFPDVVFYELPNGNVKVPAGWLIERCGWKGKRQGPVGTYQHQALVLVNHGGATGAEINDFAQRIIATVRETFGIELTPEVNIY